METTAPVKSSIFKKHEETIHEAILAIHTRKFYAKYPEPPSGKIYGETAAEDGLNAYKDQLGKSYKGGINDGDFTLKVEETSPFTLEQLGISYSAFNNISSYIDKSTTAFKAWKKISVQERAGILVDSLERIKNRFFELAHATQHTTGQAFVMSFQASGPHSNDRALEAIAMGLYEQTRFPENVIWTKPMGKMDVVLRKSYRNVPKGISLCIGCSTFPVWNSAPGIYASLVTGNTSIVKPHPGAIYPLAIMVEEIRNAAKAAGVDANIIQLAPDLASAPITKELAENNAIKIIDYTGGSHFGNYIEGLKGKTVFTEKAGINSVVLESCDNLKDTFQNLSFSLSLYSGQMCTCPQNIFIPEDGIMTGDEKLSFDQTAALLCDAIKGLVTNEKMGPGTLGAIQNAATFNRVKEAQSLGFKVLLDSIQVVNPEFPNARIATPTVIEVPADKFDVLSKEMFGPIVFIVKVKDAKAGTQIAKKIALEQGAITFSAWTKDKALQEYMTDEMADSFTSISFNFTGPIWVNQSAGFSDFHVTGGNPSGNASLTDPEFIQRRFEIVGIRVNEA